MTQNIPSEVPADAILIRCPKCQSANVDKHVLQPGDPGHGTHHAKAVCHPCGAFIRWLPDPKLTAFFEKRAKEAAKILQCPNLTAFERGFLTTMQTQRKLSPKQEEIWREMSAKR